MARKNVLSQFASLGEEALGKLAQNPGATKLLQNAMDKVDDLGKRVRGLEGMENRLAGIEKRLDRIERGSRSHGGKTAGSAKKKSASLKTKSAAVKTAGSDASAPGGHPHP
jgi:hypothetical protein